MKPVPMPDVVYTFGPNLLHPDTEPEEIARVQRNDVRRALAVLGPSASPADVSEFAVLPVATVVVRLNELAGDYETGYPRAVKPANADDPDRNGAFNRRVDKNRKRFAGRKQKVTA